MQRDRDALRDRATLFDILKAARLIVQFRNDTDEVQFRTDAKTQAAVLYEITILGEAVKRLSFGFRMANPVVPWSDIAGMRDKVIHDYDHVDLAVV